MVTIVAYASAAVAASSCPNQINACGCTVTAAGSYTVATDLSPSFLFVDCIMIDAPNVRLDLAGKSITGPPPNPLPQPQPPQTLIAGIHLGRKAANAIVAGHGATISNFTWGIVVESAGATVGGFSASSNQEAGVLLRRAAKVHVFGFDANSDGFNGVLVLGSRNCVIEGFTADNNLTTGVGIAPIFKCRAAGGFGICRSARNSSGIDIFGGEASGNAVGIEVRAGGTHNQVIGNSLKSNSTSDLVDDNGDCAHNLWFGNTFTSSNPVCIQ